MQTEIEEALSPVLHALLVARFPQLRCCVVRYKIQAPFRYYAKEFKGNVLLVANIELTDTATIDRAARSCLEILQGRTSAARVQE